MSVANPAAPSWFRGLLDDEPHAAVEFFESLIRERVDAERQNARNRETRSRLADAEAQLSETLRELRQVQRRETYLLATERQLRGIISHMSADSRGAKDVDTAALAQRHRERVRGFLGVE